MLIAQYQDTSGVATPNNKALKRTKYDIKEIYIYRN